MFKNKLLYFILGVIFIFVVSIGVTIYIGIKEKTVEISSIKIEEIDINNIKDGVYDGQFFYDESIGAKVEVTVSNNKITNIIFLEHYYGKGQKAEVIIEEVISKQSLNVDAISGATASSTVILKSIEDALTIDY